MIRLSHGDHAKGPRRGASITALPRHASQLVTMGRATCANVPHRASSAQPGRAPCRARHHQRHRSRPDPAAEYLGAAYSEGRLSKDEYDARLENALSARTYADLDQLVTDLPAAQAAAVPPRSRPPPW